FGCAFLDADGDGFPDLFVANGHVNDDVASFQPEQTYAQRPQLYLNRGGTFTEDRALIESPAMRPMIARGLAVVDFDLDGRPDVLISANNGSPRLLRNATDGPLT